MQAHVEPFYDPETGSYSYLLSDPGTRHAAVIDPVLHFDPRSGIAGAAGAQAIADRVRDKGLQVEWILETHAHADHLSAAAVLKALVGGRIGIGAGVKAVQATFRDLLDLGNEFHVDGSQFDHLFQDGERFNVGALEVSVLATPGHTSDSVSYVTNGAVFIGDTLFAPDYGTARCDFPGGDAQRLYESVQRLYSLPPDTLLYQCHDYPPATRAARPACTVREQREGNVMLRADTAKELFVAARRARDATLSVPALLYPAIQVNLRAGRAPMPAASGRSYLKIPYTSN